MAKVEAAAEPILTVVVVRADLDDDHEDAHCPGIYQVELKADTPVELLASASLDGFHGDVAIGELDEFSITVHDVTTGAVLDEPDDVESYSNSRYCIGVDLISSEVPQLYLDALTSPRSGPRP